jgi:Ran GTPase-activating protein (RanGAP) involved in mRNA processing and transport
MAMTNQNYQNPQLEEEIAKCESHSKIDLSFHQLTDHDMEIVVKQAIVEKECTVLLLHDNLITSEGVTIIANALHNNTTLQELNLWNNRASDIGVNALARALSDNNSALRSLGLGQNGITDVGARDLAEMLKINTKLTRLWLFYNEIGDQGVQLLADALARNNQSLQWLDLRLNKSVTDSSFDSLVLILKQNRSLKKFWMEYCNLSRPVKAKLRETGQEKEDFDMGA